MRFAISAILIKTDKPDDIKQNLVVTEGDDKEKVLVSYINWLFQQEQYVGYSLWKLPLVAEVKD